MVRRRLGRSEAALGGLRCTTALAGFLLLAGPVTARAGQVQSDAPTTDAATTTEDSLTHLSQTSMEIIGSLVHSFLKKQELSESDKQCLANGAQKFGGNIMMVSEHIVMLVQEVLGKRTDPNMPGLKSFKPLADLDVETGITHKAEPSLEAPRQAEPQQTDSRQSPSQQVPAEGQHGAETQPDQDDSQQEALVRNMEAAPARTEKAHSSTNDQALSYFYGKERKLKQDPLGGVSILMHLSSIFMEVGYSIQLLVKLSQHVADQCINGEALDTLQLAGAHARDVRYVGGRFLANGADVVTELAHSALAYKKGNFSAFGGEMGTALRKIFLSSNNKTAALPQGREGQKMMVNMSTGFVRGFFGKGFTLGIRLDEDPDDHIRVDLEDCIAKNMAFFEQVWSAIAFAYAKRGMLTKDPTTQAGEQQQKDGKVQFGTALAVAAMQFPDALRKCGMGQKQADMLIDSTKAFGEGMHLKLSTPNKLASGSAITHDLATTVQDWHRLEWHEFGFDLGRMLQELVLTLFPQKYSMDSSGVLQAQLVGLGAPSATPAGTGAEAHRLLPKLLPPLTVLGCIAALALARTRRDAATVRAHRETFARVPFGDGPDLEAESVPVEDERPSRPPFLASSEE